MSCPSTRRINERRVLAAHPDSEAEWAVHYCDDGIVLIRPAGRLTIPWAHVPALIGAFRAGLKMEREAGP